MVSRPTYLGGLGFGYKWNMGWMNDTLRYMCKDPIHRRYHHNLLTFGLLYAFTENFILPISHDEVVHGKCSMLMKMPGDSWQQFANLRCYFTFMWTMSGKKLLFMGCEFGQGDEWNYTKSLDWHLLQYPYQQGLQMLVRDLNALYRSNPSLYETDCFPEGFQWIDCHDSDNSIISYVRLARNPEDFLVIVCNFTPVVRRGYRLGVPKGGPYTEVLNTDAGFYAGSGVGNAGRVDAEQHEAHGRPFSLVLDLPPLGSLVLKPFPPAAPEVEVIETEADQAKPEALGAEGNSDDAAATDFSPVARRRWAPPGTAAASTSRCFPRTPKRWSSVCSTAAASGKRSASRCRSIPIRSGTATSPACTPGSSTDTGCTAPMIRATAIASTRTSS